MRPTRHTPHQRRRLHQGDVVWEENCSVVVSGHLDGQVWRERDGADDCTGRLLAAVVGRAQRVRSVPALRHKCGCWVGICGGDEIINVYVERQWFEQRASGVWGALVHEEVRWDVLGRRSDSGVPYRCGT